jgi:Xaa-Pro aminopeptidase
VISLSQRQRKLKKEGLKKPGLAHVVRDILRERGIRKVFVPHLFPLGLARELQKLNIRVKPRRGQFFHEREIKSPEEVKKISAALIMAEVGLAEGIQALRSAKPDKKRRLIYHGNPLTSEKLRAIIDTAIVQSGGLACNTIVAGGRQGCDPHERGHGVLSANEPIILDVFPRSQKTGYFGDITRTVVKGRATEPVRKLYGTIQRGQEIGFEHIGAGASGREVHQRIQKFFQAEGYKPARCMAGCKDSFTARHELSDIREFPRVGPTRVTRPGGNVVTVERTYYWEIGGGVRLEDTALVTNNGARNLTKFEKVLEV